MDCERCKESLIEIEHYGEQLIGCLECKKIMIKHVIDDLAPFREKRAHYQDKPGEVEEILAAGTAQAQGAAAATMTEVRETVGL